MSLIKLLRFKLFNDERGSLIALESCKEIPFTISRVYYMFGAGAGVSRGYHAHKELQQVAICVQGSCKFLMDNGKDKEEAILADASIGILIDKMVWHEMHNFSEDCILMVVASDTYKESDYIRNYDDFIELINSK